ncbi:MAG: hypothetical protein OEX02_19785 [Cyclobacteriaceae bacterium]|nr:hypothetical protein [Cyclobacteriaceae bacterium]
MVVFENKKAAVDFIRLMESTLGGTRAGFDLHKSYENKIEEDKKSNANSRQE